MRANTALWAAMQAARRANLAADGLPPPVSGQWGTTRRALLKGLGATGIAAALPLDPADAAMPRPRRVAIIGGGLAGLTALHHLVTAGVDARLYEARGRIGGRMHTVTHGDGTRFERGAQLVNTDHADVQALARMLGIALIDRKAGAHRTQIVADGRLIDTAELAQGLRGIARRIDIDAQRIAQDFARHAPAIDRMSIRGYLDTHAALIPAPWVRHLLEQTSRTEYGVEPTRASALELLFNLPVVDGARVEVLGGSDERFVIEGGSSRLAEALAALHADRIEMRRETIRVDDDGSGGRLRLTFRDLTTVEADRVIVAVPAPVTRYIEFAVPLPRIWHDFIGAMETGRNEKLQWAMAATPWRAGLGAGGELWTADADAPVALAWEGTVHSGGGGDVPTWTWFFGGDQPCGDGEPPPGALAQAVAPAVAGLDTARVPGFAFDRTAWARDPLSRGAYSNFPPGQLTRFADLLWLEPEGRARPARGTGRLLFAGEHLSDAFPGYMNGAAQTGRLAAETAADRHPGCRVGQGSHLGGRRAASSRRPKATKP